MFKTKSEVDKHVGKIFLKAKTDSEVESWQSKLNYFYFFSNFFYVCLKEKQRML